MPNFLKTFFIIFNLPWLDHSVSEMC